MREKSKNCEQKKRLANENEEKTTRHKDESEKTGGKYREKNVRRRAVKNENECCV